MHTHFKKVFVLGLGLIGGSFVKSLKDKNYKICAYDKNKDAREYFKNNYDLEVISENIEDCIRTSDIIVLAVLPSVAVEFIKKYKTFIKIDSIICDMCGVKRNISNECNNLKYVSIHTMAGKEIGGYKNSSQTLFLGSNAIIVKNSLACNEDLESIKLLALDIGCKNIKLASVEEHDKQIAFTSQLMHIIASGIVISDNFVNSLGFEGNSLSDHTRVGQIDDNMWSELFLFNSDYLLNALDDYILNLKKYEEALKNKDREKIRELLKFGNDEKVRWLYEKSKS